MKIWILAAAAALGSGPAAAELREMPDYFVQALVSTSAAQALALSCPEISVNPVAAVKASEALLEQLEADGIDASNPTDSFLSGDEKLETAQVAFMDKHQLEGATADAVCAAARVEIAESSPIGTLLVEEAQ